MTEVILEKPLFASSHEALAFAFNHAGYPAGPLMNRLAGGARHEGRGLSGENGAGQAGMIKRCLERLSPLHRSVLRARYGPATRECSCCGQPAPHHEWVSSVKIITSHALERLESMPSVSDALVYALVARYFSKDRTSLEIVGSKCGVSLSTASRANSEITLWLRGPKKVRPGFPERGVDAIAFAEADSILTSAGFIR